MAEADPIDRRDLVQILVERLDQWKALEKRGGSLAKIASQELEDVLEIVKTVPSL